MYLSGFSYCIGYEDLGKLKHSYTYSGFEERDLFKYCNTELEVSAKCTQQLGWQIFQAEYRIPLATLVYTNNVKKSTMLRNKCHVGVTMRLFFQ
jgi:hypothetical protein